MSARRVVVDQLRKRPLVVLTRRAALLSSTLTSLTSSKMRAASTSGDMLLKYSSKYFEDCSPLATSALRATLTSDCSYATSWTGALSTGAFSTGAFSTDVPHPMIDRQRSERQAIALRCKQCRSRFSSSSGRDSSGGLAPTSCSGLRANLAGSFKHLGNDPASLARV